MVRTGIRKTALSLAVAGAFAGGVSQAHAAAFALIEQNASGLGNSYAGAAAAAFPPPRRLWAVPEGTLAACRPCLIFTLRRMSQRT